ncbi:PAP1-domain-containing protein [Xylariaceae sp. FL0804]|nr:PAP1-domain-containing protein [Xylariaceae sp. FL0804]
MSSGRSNAVPDFILTPQQQSLLFRALTSNQPADSRGLNNPVSLSPPSLATSPVQNQPNAGPDAANEFQESPFLDYDYDLGQDSNFDLDFSNDGQVKMIGDLPGSSPGDKESKDGSKASVSDHETSDKRSHPDEDDDEEVEGGGKRRESEGKIAKKPGRKPLTNEPSSKRKAQNRAAQRAFRERKEKHLKDLETKVEELEKASAATTSENSQLRAQVENMSAELAQYKKKLTLLNSSNTRSPSASSLGRPPFGSAVMANISDVNFQFEFPKFGGVLPGPQTTNPGAAKPSSPYPSPSSGQSANGQASPSQQSRDSATRDSSKGRDDSTSQPKDSLTQFSGLFDNSSPYENNFAGNGSRTSLDSAQFSLNGGNTGSPASSSNSNAGPSSSCGTSPEPFNQSPLGFKPLETLTTIGEEQPSLPSDTMSGNLGNLDFSSIDWLSQQNGGQFDPQLFGDYREPQDSVLANTTFDDSFFNEAFDMDFTTPYNMPTAPASSAPKKSICADIDAKKEDDDTIVTTPGGKMLTCNNVWEKLQGCPQVQAGDLDLDSLCSDLQSKAKCGGSGAVVGEDDFKRVIRKYLKKDARCPEGTK